MLPCAGRAPRPGLPKLRTVFKLPGEIARLPNLAESFRVLSNEGPQGFYGGRIGAAIVSTLSGICRILYLKSPDAGGVMTMDDLVSHRCGHMAW